MGPLRENADSELLTFRIHFTRIGAGLQNLGNTCYLNSVLQCLTYTEPLAAYLQSGKHQTACQMAGFCALCAIQKHVSRALNSTGRILAPKDLVSNLRCISRSFRSSRQQDAHEYMVNLLESMHKCSLPSGVPSESPSAHERSLVHKIFGGQLRSQVRCQQCSFCSDKFDPFLDLSLEIAKTDSLCKALAHFTAKEQLDGGASQYQCQQCNQKVKAFKQLTIYKPPHVLTIHLKRFDPYNPGQKIDKRIAFGPTLDLKPFVTVPDERDLKYTLYGVLVHAGWSTRSGHYFSFVRTSGGTWYSLDDNQVVQVTEKRVLEQKAYMLFYVRNRKIPVPKVPANLGVKKNIINNELGPKELCPSDFIKRSTNVRLSQASIQGAMLSPRASTEGFQKVEVSVNSNDLKTDKEPLLDGVSYKSKPTSLQSYSPTLNIGEAILASCGKTSNSNLHPSNDILSSANTVDGNQKDISASVGGLSHSNAPHFIANQGRCNPSVPLLSCSGQVGFKKASTDVVSKPPKTSVLGSTTEVECSTDRSQKGYILSKKAADRKPHLIAKKKILKRCILKMHLSTNIIAGTISRLRKRKKLKRSGSCNLLNKRQEPVEHEKIKESISCPSTSENTKMHSWDVSKFKPHRKQIKDEVFDRKYVSGRSDLRERTNEERVQLRTGKQQQGAGHQSGTRELSWLDVKRKEENQPGLPRVLEETIVAKWDDIKALATEGTKSERVGSVSIGYVGDEWEKEYDRGKRKKLRWNKSNFGGRNFREIYSKNFERKRAY